MHILCKRRLPRVFKCFGVTAQVLRLVDTEDGDNPIVAVEDSVALAGHPAFGFLYSQP